MTSEGFDNYLKLFMLMCCCGIALNLLMIRRRGRSAILLAVALLLLIGAVELYRIGASTVVVAIGGALVAVVLIADLILRYSPPSTRTRR